MRFMNVAPNEIWEVKHTEYLLMWVGDLLGGSTWAKNKRGFNLYF